MINVKIPLTDVAAALFLVPAAIFDLREKLIPMGLLLAGMGADLFYIICSVMRGSRTIGGILLCLFPGVLLVIAALITKGKAGIGDGISMILLGIPIGLEKVFVVLTGGLFLMSLFGIALVMMRRGDRNTKMPFLPFCLLVFGGMLCTEL